MVTFVITIIIAGVLVRNFPTVIVPEIQRSAVGVDSYEVGANPGVSVVVFRRRSCQDHTRGRLGPFLCRDNPKLY